jgi:DNA-damage-inducible protein J
MSTKQAYIRTRIDPEVKAASDRILQQLGLTTPEAIRLFLTQVVLREGLPFRVELQPPQHENEDLLLPAPMRQAALDVVYDD